MTDHNDRCCSPEQFAGQPHPDCSGLRPAVPFPAPAGHHWEAVARDDWRPVQGKRCRRRVTGRGGGNCGKPAVLETNRGMRIKTRVVEAWWAYCPEHAYGNWLEDGKAWRWKLVADTPDPEGT